MLFLQDRLCYLRKNVIKEGDFTRALPVGTEKTATFSSGRTRRLVLFTYDHADTMCYLI